LVKNSRRRRKAGEEEEEEEEGERALIDDAAEFERLFVPHAYAYCQRASLGQEFI
jgi:hypothetical protein